MQTPPAPRALGAIWRKVQWIPIPPAPSSAPLAQPWVPRRVGISRRAVLIGGMVGLLAGASVLTGLGISKLVGHSRAAAPRPGSHPHTTPKPTHTATPTPAPKPGDTLFTYHGHTAFLRGVSWSPDGRRIASASDDGTVQVWDAFTGAQPLTYKEHTGAVMSVAWSPDGTFLASGSQDRTLRVWDTVSGQTQHNYTFGKQVMAVAWSPNGSYLAAASWDFTVGVWDTKTWQRLHRFGAPGSINAVSWSPDNIHLVTGDVTKQAIIWNAVTGDKIATYRGQTAAILALAWAPEGSGIASGADLPDTTVHYWNSTTLKPIWNVSTQGSTQSLAWSPNGAQLAMGASQVHLLNPLTGGQMLSYQGDASALSWSPNGRYIASGGQSTTVQIWQAT